MCVRSIFWFIEIVVILFVVIMADMSAFVPKKMAEWERKVDHLIWQIEVTSDEKWEELTKLQGLIGNLFDLKLQVLLKAINKSFTF